MKNPFTQPLSRNARLILLGVILIIGLGTYFYVNSQLEAGAYTQTSVNYLDPTGCEYQELDNDRIQLTVTTAFAGEATQDDLDAVATELGYESVTLGEDGRITYIITKEQHAEMLKELSGGIRNTINAMIGSKDYKKITAIDINEDFTDIKVTLSTKDLDYNTSMSMIQFKSYATLYHVYAGIPDAVLKVEYYGKDNNLVSTLTNESE